MMLPRVAALAAVVLLVLPTLPLVSAQSPPTPDDLRVTRIQLTDDASGGAGVQGMPGTFRIAVKNHGESPFRAQTGWQIFIGYNGNARGDCIVRDQVPENSACYQKFEGNHPFSSIPAGGEVVVTFAFTPGVVHIGTARDGNGRVFTTIQPYGTVQGSGVPQQGPDSVSNNNQQDFPLFVRAPGVQAAPVFEEKSPTQGSGPNTPWRFEHVVAKCEPLPAMNDRGCRATPGHEIRFQYRVDNKGNWIDSYTATLTDGDGLRNRGYQFVFSPNPVTVGAGQSQRVEVKVVVPEGARLYDDININTSDTKISWASGMNSAFTTAAPPLSACPEGDTSGICEDPAMFSVLIDVRRGLNATSNETVRHVFTGLPETFNVTLNNTGNAADTYRLTRVEEGSQINSTWTPSFPQTVTVDPWFTRMTQSTPLPPGQNVTLSLVPPANATMGPHDFEMTFQSLNDAKTLRKLKFTANLEQRFGVATGLRTSLIRAVPGETISFQVDVRNTGNGWDNVTLELDNIPPGWNRVSLAPRVVMVGPTQTPFESAPAWLNITIPDNTPRDTRGALFINASASGPFNLPTEQRPRALNLVANVEVLEGSFLVTDVPVRGAFVDPGKNGEFDIHLRNAGNVADKFDVTVDSTPWTSVASPTSVVLQPLATGTVRVTMRAPALAEVGETSRAVVSFKGAVDQARGTSVTLQGNVSGPDLFVSRVLLNATTPYSGDPLEVTITMGNKGNKAPERPVVASLYFVQGGVERPIGNRTLQPADLPGGRQVSERIIWDTGTVEGAGIVVARIDEEKLVKEIDESPGDNSASQPVTLRRHDIRITPPTPLTGRPGAEVPYTTNPHVFVVEYRGNQPKEPVLITLRSQNGWGSVEQNVDLPRGTPYEVPITLRVPTLPGVASDRLTLVVTPALRPTSVQNESITTALIDDEKPRILGVSATPLEAKIGESITLNALVQDATGLASVRAFITSPSNETSSAPMVKAEGDRWTLTQTFRAAGTYRFFIEAVDASESQNRNTSREQIATFSLAPGSVPSIKLAEGQSATVRPGARVKLDITDPLGVARASYALRGLTYEMQPPYEIDTAGLPRGETAVTVSAQNLYGGASTTRILIDVDDTPPGIRKVTLDPPQPRVNEDVRLRIETDAKVTGVDVLIKKDGAVVETRPAVRRSAGTFELLLNPSEGDFVLDVTARDAAGNTKLQESAVAFSAKPGSPFDVPLGPWVLLAALAAAAVLVRRRSGGRPPES